MSIVKPGIEQIMKDMVNQMMNSQIITPVGPGQMLPPSGLQTLLEELEQTSLNNKFMGKKEFDEAFGAFMGDMLLAETSKETTEWISKFHKRIYERMGWKNETK